MKEKICIDCGSKNVVERRRCIECAKKYNRERAKKYYRDKGKKKREAKLPKAICPICNKEMTMWSKNQASHLSCRPKSVKNYNDVPRSKKGTMLVKEILFKKGVIVPKGYVIHHLDENPWNNIPENLWLMPKGAHASLHRKLQYQKSLWLKNNSSDNDNEWKSIRDHIMLAWLETTSAKVLKVCNILQVV